jgi:dGTPase
MGLNEDLCEAISLAHDLGHTPFGHAGQDALDECLRRADPSSGGFEHNFQSLRVVDVLEERYAAFDGLNLTFETREGILKHCSRRRAEELEHAEPSGVGHRFLARTQPSLEAQVCNLADEIAYNAHDIDDGVRSGLLLHEQLLMLPLFARFHAEALRTSPTLVGRRVLYETIRRMLSAQVYDVIDTSEALIREHAPAGVDAVRASPPLIGFSLGMQSEVVQVKAFLRQELYRHPKVVATTEGAKQVIRSIFEVYRARPAELPANHAIADYIAGMTDRFALREHERLVGPAPIPAQ